MLIKHISQSDVFIGSYQTGSEENLRIYFNFHKKFTGFIMTPNWAFCDMWVDSITGEI